MRKCQDCQEECLVAQARGPGYECQHECAYAGRMANYKPKLIRWNPAWPGEIDINDLTETEFHDAIGLDRI